MGKYNKKPSAVPEGENAPPQGAQKDVSSQLQSNPEFRKIASWLSGVKFKKKVFGGLDPVDVWKKIEELNHYYENALIAERARYDLQLDQLKRYVARNSAHSAQNRERDGNG